MGLLEDSPMMTLAVLGAVIVGAGIACYVLTNLAYWYSARLGGYPPRERWQLGQIAFWRYVRQHSRRSQARLLLVMAVCHHVIAAAGLVAFVALFLVAASV
jgi:hypothetical protein